MAEDKMPGMVGRREHFGRPLRWLVTESGLGVAELSRRSGVAQSSLYAWFNGTTAPNVTTLELVLKQFEAGRRHRRWFLDTLEALREGRTPPPPPFRDEIAPEPGVSAPVSSRRRLSGQWMGVAPPPARPFVGRDEALVALRRNLSTHGTVVLQGVSGVGKTSLALEYLTRFGRYHDVAIWIDGSEPALVADQLAQAAVELGVVQAGGLSEPAAEALRAIARVERRWVVVLDDAHEEAWVALDLASAACARLLCSRAAPAGLRAEVMPLGEFSREETRAMLLLCRPALPSSAVERLAEHTQGLPLAIRQVASVLEQTGMDPGRYLEVIADHVAEALDAGVPSSYPVSLPAVTRMGMAQARAADPQAADLLALLATMARAPVPLSWISMMHPVTGRREDWSHEASRRACELLAGAGLAAHAPASVAVHGLTARLVLEALAPHARAAAWSRAADLVAMVAPEAPVAQPDIWAALLPHLLALRPDQHPEHEGLRHVAMKAAWSTSVWGDGRLGLDIVRAVRVALYDRLGAKHPDSLQAGHVEAWLLSVRGRWREAYNLGARVYRSRLELFGATDPKTLSSAGNLATYLYKLGHPAAGAALAGRLAETAAMVFGNDSTYYWTMVSQEAICLGAAGQLDEAERQMRAVVDHFTLLHGDDHPSTLAQRSNLAEVHRLLGRPEQAARESLDVVRRFLGAVGDDHPDVYSAISWLARAYADLPHGRRAAQHLIQVVHRRRERLLGAEHPSTREAWAEAVALGVELGTRPSVGGHA